MKVEDIDNITLKYLDIDDYQELKDVMIEAYPTMGTYWKEGHIEKLLSIFPEGQVVVKVNGELAGCALSIIVDYDKYDDAHTYRDITDNDTFNSHQQDGDVLYGIDVFIRPEFRGLRLGRRLYDYRKELCENLNLKRIVFGGRMPNYHKYADSLTPKQYIQKVRSKQIDDPVLNFQISNDFHPIRILKGYLEGDEASGEFAVLMAWNNIYYVSPEEESAPQAIKSVVRLGLIQWQMRRYAGMEDMMDQVEYFVDSMAGYHCDFALFPEFFNAPLMADYNHLGEAEAIRELAKHTKEIKERLSQLSISYNINIITGSMPEVVRDKLYNVGYLCRRDGSVERFEKIHVTPDEARVWE